MIRCYMNVWQEHRLKESISMSNHKLIEAVTKSQLRTDLPTFHGDTLRTRTYRRRFT